MISATLDVRQWLNTTNKLKAVFRDKTALLKAAFSIAGFRDIQDHFKQESGPDGNWKARKESTQLAYFRKSKYDARYNPSNKLLQLTGNLRQSVMSSRADIKPMGPNAIQVFAGANYSNVHDSGGNKMPQRKFMWLSKTALDQMNEIILKRLAGE